METPGPYKAAPAGRIGHSPDPPFRRQVCPFAPPLANLIYSFDSARNKPNLASDRQYQCASVPSGPELTNSGSRTSFPPISCRSSFSPSSSSSSRSSFRFHGHSFPTSHHADHHQQHAYGATRCSGCSGCWEHSSQQRRHHVSGVLGGLLGGLPGGLQHAGGHGQQHQRHQQQRHPCEVGTTAAQQQRNSPAACV